MKPTSIASSSPVQIQHRSNHESEKQIGSPPVWSRRSAPASSPAIAAQPKPNGANVVAKQEPGSHRAVSSTPPHQPQPRPISEVPMHAAEPGEAPASNSPGLGTRIANAFESTSGEVVSGLKERPIRSLLNPTRAVVSTIGTFVYYLFRPAK